MSVDVVRQELEAFASSVIGMSAEEIASTTASQSETLLRLKLAYESKDMAQYACATVDPDVARRIREWGAGQRSPPAFYRYVFSNAQIPVAAMPQAFGRFKEHVGVANDAVALRLFHAVNFGCPRDEMMDASDNNRTQANVISNQIAHYAEHVEGGDRSVFQEEWAQFLKEDIGFPFFKDGRVILNAVASGDGVEKKEEQPVFLQEQEPVDKPIPFVAEETAPEPITIVGNALLDAYRKRAGVPLTFSLHTAAKQLVSALVCKQIPAQLLHRDQDPEEVAEAVHGLPHLTRENFGPLAKASVDVSAIRDCAECREYYWKNSKGSVVGDSAEFVADVLWNCVQQKRVLNTSVV
jgi:hypothetical protein